MWKRLGKFVLKFRLPLLIILFCTTAVMGYFASKVKLNYEFAKAIPRDNPKYQEYLSFKARFGEDGNLMVIAIQTDKFFELNTFKAFAKLNADLKKVRYVEDVLSVSTSVNLIKDTSSEKLVAVPIFPHDSLTQQSLDSSKNVFLNLPFYRSLLYNPETHTYFLDGEYSFYISQLLKALHPDELVEIKLNKVIRKDILSAFQSYYALHIQDFGVMKTLPVLHEVLG